MADCVSSARRTGVFKEFHVLTDSPIEGCECYDAQTIEKTGHLFKLIYLKAAISKLLFDYFIWIDADTWFVRNTKNVLDCLGKSPIHVPLTSNLSQLHEEKPLKGISTRQYVSLMAKAGVLGPIYFSGSSFWILHHDAIDRVCELAQYFRAIAAKDCLQMDVSAALGYAMQMLCADPDSHRATKWPDLWASDDQDFFNGGSPVNSVWPIKDSLTGETTLASPCIIHLPHRKTFARGEPSPMALEGNPVNVERLEGRNHAMADS